MKKTTLIACFLALSAPAMARAAVTTSFIGGTVKITGTSGDDAVEVDIGEGNFYIYELTLSTPITCAASWTSYATTSRKGLIASYSAAEAYRVEFSGGAGNDYFKNGADLPSSISGGDGIDVLIGGFDEDTIKADASTAYCNLVYGGDGNDTLSGGVLGTTCSATQYLHGEGGDDWISLGDGNNSSPEASSCPLRAWGGDGDDTIIGGTSADEISSEAGEDTILAGAGNDKVWGGDDYDGMLLGDGDDWTDGGAGEDVIYGGAGNDTIHGGDDTDHLYGEDGDDTVFAGADDDYIYGGNGDDKLYGESGRDHLEGNDGTDYVSGGTGNDWLSGGSGRDECNGGSGTDSFTSSC